MILFKYIFDLKTPASKLREGEKILNFGQLFLIPFLLFYKLPDKPKFYGNAQFVPTKIRRYYMPFFNRR